MRDHFVSFWMVSLRDPATNGRWKGEITRHNFRDSYGKHRLPKEVNELNKQKVPG